MSRYTTFWDWFLEVSEEFYINLEKNTDDIALSITEHLKKVHPDIEFEIPFDLEDGKRQLIISADGDESLFDEVLAFTSSAPNIDKWEIISFRPRLHQRNQIIDLDGITMDYHDILFQYEEVENQIIIDVYINNFDGTDNRYIHLYFLLLDSLIGEFDSVKKIKETRIYPLKEQSNLLEFPKLLQIIDQLKNKDK